MSAQHTPLADTIRFLCPDYLSQADLAEKLVVEPAIITRWKQGRTGSLTWKRGAKLCALLRELDAATPLIDGLIRLTVMSMPSNADADRDCNPLLAKLHDTKSNAEAWYTVLIFLGFLIRQAQWDTAYALGYRAWKHKRLQNDFIAYSIRGALVEAKTGLSRSSRLSAVAELGTSIGVGTDLPVTDYEAVHEPRLMQASDLPPFDAVAWAPLDFAPLTERFATSSKLNDKIAAGDLSQLRLHHRDKSHYEIPRDWHLFAWLALNRAFDERGDLFDGDKLRFLGLGIEQWFKDKRVTVEKTTYVRTVVTNQALRWRFQHRETGACVELQRDGGQDFALAEKLSSHIGVSSLIISKDNKLVALQQSAACRQEADRLVPFSGSIDLEDFEQNHSGDWPTLEELVTRGLAREVQEECCVAPKDTRHMVLALTLDLQLGMKPDFFGVSFINENWQALEKRREPLYGGPLDAQDVDLLTVERFQKSIDRIASQWAGQKSAFLMANLVFLRSNYSQINELRNSLLLEYDDP